MTPGHHLRHCPRPRIAAVCPSLKPCPPYSPNRFNYDRDLDSFRDTRRLGLGVTDPEFGRSRCAILLHGFADAFRRSELVALNVFDLEERGRRPRDDEQDGPKRVTPDHRHCARLSRLPAACAL